MAVQTYTSGLLLYDLSANPISFSVLESQVGQIAITGDGSTLIDTIFDNETGMPAVTVWDTASATSRLTVQIPDELFTNAVDITQQGSFFATGHGAVGPFAGPLPEGATNTVRLWDATIAAPIATLEQASGASHLAFSPSGSQVAVGTDLGVTIWDVGSQQQIGEIAAIPPFSGNALAFSPDETRLAVGQADGMLSVWDTASFANIYSIELLPETSYIDAVVAVTFSPDGSLIAASGGPFVDGPPPADDNVQVVVLDASNGTRLAGAQNLNGIPFSVRFTADGSLLIFPTGNTVQFWGVAQ